MQIRKLSSEDCKLFLEFRSKALIESAQFFRVSAADDLKLDGTYWRNRLDTDRVYGIFQLDSLIAIGGLSRFVGEKLSHKGLIWGMYIAPSARGTQASDLLMAALLNGAKGFVTHLQLTLMADNVRARRYYERHKFEVYAIEPASVMTEQGPADEALMWRLVDLAKR